MKTLLFIAVFLIPSLGYALSAEEETEFKVYGVCHVQGPDTLSFR